MDDCVNRNSDNINGYMHILSDDDRFSCCIGKVTVPKDAYMTRGDRVSDIEVNEIHCWQWPGWFSEGKFERVRTVDAIPEYNTTYTEGHRYSMPLTEPKDWYKFHRTIGDLLLYDMANPCSLLHTRQPSLIWHGVNLEHYTNAYRRAANNL